MTHLTKVATLASSILRQMTGIGTWQYKFLLTLFPLWLSIRGRYNFANLARYSNYIESTFRNNFAKEFNWLDFNHRLVKRTLTGPLLIALDPSYLPKSGKFTEGLDSYWSGQAGAVKRGLEICGLAAVDYQHNQAMHLRAFQTLERDENETLLDYYARGLIRHAPTLQSLSKYVVADAYFGAQSFIAQLTQAGFEVVTRLKKNVALRYYYCGERKSKMGRPLTYDGKVDPRNLNPAVFTECGRDSKANGWVAYEAKVHVNAWKRAAKVVIVHQLDRKGKVKSYRIFASTDTELTGQDMLRMYPARFQQEFLFRDAKQELGLAHCQAYTSDKIDFHINCSLTVLSLAKAAHYLKEGDRPPSFSIADIKTEYVNGHQGLRIISLLGFDVNTAKIKSLLPKVLSYGLRRG